MTPDASFVRVMTRLAHILRQWKACIQFKSELYDRGRNTGGSGCVWIHSLKIMLPHCEYEYGTKIEQLASIDGAPAIQPDAADPKMPHRIASFVQHMNRFFRDTHLVITKNGRWMIGKETLYVSFPTCMDYHSVLASLEYYKTTCEGATDMIFELADILKKYNAAIEWQEDVQAGSCFGKDAPLTYAVLSCGGHHIVRKKEIHGILRAHDLTMEETFFRGWPNTGCDAVFKKFVCELHDLMERNNMYIKYGTNDIYKDNTLVCSNLLQLSWYYVFSAAQHGSGV